MFQIKGRVRLSAMSTPPLHVLIIENIFLLIFFLLINFLILMESCVKILTWAFDLRFKKTGFFIQSKRLSSKVRTPYPRWVNFGILKLDKWEIKCFGQILVVVSFTTDHDNQFYTHFTHPPCLVSNLEKSPPSLNAEKIKGGPVLA